MWSVSRSGQIPSGAIVGGREGNGDIYYIGRAEFRNSLVIGKVQPSHKILYVPFDGKEIKINVYEVLCIRK